MRRVVAGLLPVLALCACERQATETPDGAARPEPVVVYASYEDQNYLPSLFAEFTRDSGIPVSVRHRPEEQIVSEVIEKRDSPRADLLLTRSVHGAWRAAAEGALRPLQSEAVDGLVPEWLRDPDGYWTATGIDTIGVVCRADSQRDCDSVASYEDLALPPYEYEQALLQAVEAGTCRLAVVSGNAFREFGKPTVTAVRPRPGYFNVTAAGVGRHARSPDAARRLVEWLVAEDAQAAQFAATGLRPVNSAVAAGSFAFPAAGKRNAGIVGLWETAAIKLAERARWD
jgi:iron(III) transport system substrate-binding protein